MDKSDEERNVRAISRQQKCGRCCSSQTTEITFPKGWEKELQIVQSETRTTTHRRGLQEVNPLQSGSPLPPPSLRPLVNLESYTQLPTITGREALFRVSPPGQHCRELSQGLPSLGASEITFLVPRVPAHVLHDSSSGRSRAE